jgi:chemotaxis protein MotB
MQSSLYSPRPRSGSAASLRDSASQPRRVSTEDDIGWWPITFSDLVLLLLCFVVLWHVAEKKRMGKALPPPTQPTAPPPAPLAPEIRSWSFSPEIKPALAEEPLEPLPAPAPHTVIEEPEQLSSVPTSSPPPSTANTNWQALQAQLDDYIRGHGLGHVVGVVSSEQGLVISLSDTITFPSGQTTLSPAVAPLLSQVATLATERPDLDIEIAGHTDDRPISTTEFPSNWELSAARASRVTRALLEQGPLDPTRISTRGYAYYRPVQANDTEEHRAANRRVEIRFFHRVKSSD